MPRIAIDYTAAYEQGGGIGRYVRDLVEALAKVDTKTDYRLFVSGALPRQLQQVPGQNFTWKPTRIEPKWLARIWHRLQLPLPVEAFVGQVDLYHATNFVLPPHLPGLKTLLTVHDLSFVRVPEAASPSLKRYLDAVVPRSVHRATHILADSQATKDDLIDLYAVPSDKVTVLLSGIDPRFRRIVDNFDISTMRIEYNLPQTDYIFSIGTVQPRKNYERLIHALANLRSRGQDVDLIIAGGKGWLEDPIYQAIDNLCLADHVHMIGFADDEDLPALYSGAKCVAFPSLYEGFGFPVLEGMACGTPVITSNVSSLPEVAGDAAIMIDPYDVDALTDALHAILNDNNLRQSMIRKGHEQVSRFTWGRTAQQLHDIYMNLL